MLLLLLRRLLLRLRIRSVIPVDSCCPHRVGELAKRNEIKNEQLTLRLHHLLAAMSRNLNDLQMRELVMVFIRPRRAPPLLGCRSSL